MTIRPGTWVAAALALGAVALVHRDPWQRTTPGVAYVSHHAAATRLLPELPEGVPADLVIELVRADGTITRLGPDDAGNAWVWEARTSIGPADPDALDGLWSSLRGISTLRAASEPLEGASAGRIRISTGSLALELALGGATPDGVGIYARADGDATWVVETWVGELVAQRGEAWAARRPLLVDPAEVVRIAFADATLERGPDRLWRSDVAGAHALLSTSAVEARLGRLLTARLDPWQPPWIDVQNAQTPWLRIVTESGTAAALWHRPGCGEGRVAVDRGAGLAGCVDAGLVEPWPLPGAANADPAWIDARVLPHVYGRVLRIEQRRPHASVLRRDGGGWVIERTVDGKQEVATVGESEVFRWYDELHRARMATREPMAARESEVELVVSTDATTTLRLGCARDRDAAWTCKRDDESGYAVTIPVELAFTPDTFADRQLAAIDPGDVRAIEVAGRTVVRQGAHLDLGVWRLDAPRHPAGDAALDELRLEELVSTVSRLRAVEWVQRPESEPERSIRVERVATDSRASAIDLRVWSGCIVAVGEGPAARVSEGSCRGLATDILIDAPLERAIEDAAALEIRIGDAAVPLVREGESWRRADGEPLGALVDPLRRWPTLVATRLVPGEPSGAVVAVLAVEPSVGEPYTIEVADGWARIVGQAWYYPLAVRDEADNDGSDAADDDASDSTADEPIP